MNYSVAHLGPWKGWERHEYFHPRLNRKIRGRVFLRKLLGLTGMEVSLNKLPARAEVPFYHAHRENEELYLFLQGRGQFQVDGQSFDVQEGSVVRVKTSGMRTWRNASDEDLYFACIQAKEGSLTADEVSDGIPGEAPVRW